MVATARRREPSRGVFRRCEEQKIEVTMSTERQLGEVRFLTVAEVATIMRVSKMTVYRMVHAGELPAIRVGRSFRVPEDEVHTYLRSSFVDTA
jgi:excisionase family DNA binding protein